MEDYSPTQEEVEGTPSKRRRWLTGNFLNSWLEKRRDDDDEDDEEKADKNTKKAETKKDDEKKSQWLGKLLSIFKSEVTIEPIAVESELKTEQSEVFNTEKIDAEPGQITEVIAENESLEEEGLLAVSADAQKRYYGYELMDEPGLEDETTDITAEAEDEIVNLRNRQQTSYADQAPAETKPTQSKTTEPVGEVLRRRQTDRLERKVKKLKKQTKSLKREQADVAKRQAEFTRELDEQQKARERFEKVTVPKMEKARQQLQQRLEQPLSEVKLETVEAKSAVPEHYNQKPTVKTELVEAAKVEKAAQPEARAVSEQLKQMFELAPVQSQLIESSFERRHEVKDVPAGDMVSTTLPTPTSSGMPPSVPPPLLFNPGSDVNPPASSRLPRMPFVQPGANMYQQAIKNGSVGGLIIIILLLLLMWIQ